jgi:hypothetical protein
MSLGGGSLDRPNLARLDEDRGRQTVAYLQSTGILRIVARREPSRLHPAARRRPNRVITLTFWTSLDAVKAFAGEDVDRPSSVGDDRFLVDREHRPISTQSA